MNLLLLFATIVLAALSLTPRLPARTNLLIDLPSHFIVQYSVGAMILFVLALFFHAPAAAFFALCAFIINLIELKPLLPRKDASPPADPRLKVLQVNLLKSNRQPDALLKLVAAEKPDIITCCEVNPLFADALRGLAAEYPHQLITSGTDDYRVALLSKLPFSKIEQTAFGGARTEAIVFQVAFEGRTIGGVSLHPYTPNANIHSRDSEFAAIAARFASEQPQHLMLMGDFNATPWCPAMKQLVRRLRLRNAREGRGINTSWPSFFPFLFRIPIDHVLVSTNLGVSAFHAGYLDGSDHRPTITTLFLK